jgi:hypothetical protein
MRGAPMVRNAAAEIAATLLLLGGCHNQGNLRFIQASPDTQAIDISIKGNGAGAGPLFAGVKFTETTGYANVNVGTYVVEIRPAGTDPSSTPLFVSTPITVGDRTRYTAIVAGLQGSAAAANSLRVITLEDDFAPAGAIAARSRSINASPDAPTVTFSAGATGGVIASALPLFAATAPPGIDLPGDQQIHLTLMAEGTPAMQAAFTTQFVVGDQVNLIAIGLARATPPTLQLLVVDTSGTAAVLSPGS